MVETNNLCDSSKRFFVSIITVVLNNAIEIEKTLHSVILHKIPNIEYIIVDGGSTDGTVSVIKKYKTHINKYISEKDNGIYDAMNKGAKLANGEYLLFLNAGDCITTEFANSLKNGEISALISNQKNPTVIIYGDVLLSSNSAIMKYYKAQHINFLYFKMPFCHQSSLILTNEFKKIEFDINLKIGSDYKLYRQLYMNKSKFTYIGIPFSIYNIDGFSSKNPLKLLKEYKSIIKEEKHYLKNIIAIIITNIKLLKHEIFSRI